MINFFLQRSGSSLVGSSISWEKKSRGGRDSILYAFHDYPVISAYVIGRSPLAHVNEWPFEPKICGEIKDNKVDHKIVL